MWGLSCRCSQGSGNRVKEVSCRASRGAAEDVAGEDRDFDNGVDRREVRDYQHRRYANQVSGRNESGDLRVDDAERELADDVENTRGDHLIEGVLNKSLQPTPKEPVELGNDKEWNKHRSQENAKRRGHNAEGHNDERQSLGDNRPKPQQGIQEGGDWLCNSRRFEIAQHILRVVCNSLRVSLADLIREAGRFIGDEMMKVAPKSRDGRVIVVHHRESKADHENQRYKVGEMKAAASLAGGKTRLDAVPNDENGGEGPEQVLPHAIEDPKVLLHKRVNRLEDFVEKVHGFILCS